MSFYKEIVHRLFVWNTRIGEAELEPFEYIEEKHKEAPYKGKVFYTNLMRELSNHFGAELRNDFYLELLNYCDQKIREVADTRYFLTTFVDGQAQKQSLYIAYKGTVESKGFVRVGLEAQTLKVYTPELAFILTSKELPAFNKDLKKETKINGWEYLQTYAYGYKEGQAYFDAEFKVSPDTLYGANASQYVKDIHINYFHNKYKGGHEGWAFVKRFFPFLITHKEISEFGYFSGIVSRVEEQIEKYPRLFATFDKCEHNLEPQQTETKTDKLKVEQGKYGFFELPKVKQLSEPNKQSLVEMISKNGLPYSIAMFEFLGFLKHIEDEHFKTKYKLNKEISKWFNSDKEGRAVKGNISSLSVKSKEDKRKYTAHTHKETVKTDYQKLK